MTNQEYIENVMRTESANFCPNNISSRTQHAIIGLVTEAGEAMDAVKKSLFYNQPFDRTNLKEELGDALWYIAVACQTNGWTMEEVMEANIRKLRVRYPEKFTEQDAEHRNLDEERGAL